MASNVRNIKMPSVDELFSTEEMRSTEKSTKERVTMLPISEIDPFPDHPFHVIDDAEMQNMVESIKQFGVLTPAIVRKKEDGRYELISGHRRKRACELAGIEKLPIIVRQMTRDEAIIFMVDSNLQREKILPSEKAFSYKMKLEAIRRQAGRPSKDNSAPVVQNYGGKTSREIIAEKSGDSHEQVRRYIRLTYLTPALLQIVDDGKIAFRPAVELSYLPEEAQNSLIETMECEDSTPSLAQAIKLKKFAQEGRLNEDVILSILSEEKPNQKEVFKLPRERFEKYFPRGTTPEKVEETIVKALDMYYKRLERIKQEREYER